VVVASVRHGLALSGYERRLKRDISVLLV